jgi:DNA-binding transcriptional LysR family regulator
MATIIDKTAGLAAFVETVATGSFSEAGHRLGASPSAVSKSVSRLERRLGVRLLQRSTRSLSLTAEGAAYFERIAPLIAAIGDAEDVLHAAGEARGLLRITAPTDLSRLLIAGWVEEFSVRHPRLKLELAVADRHVDLIREGYDIALRVGPPADMGLVGRKLADLPAALVAAPVYLQRRGTPNTIDELHDHACLRYLSPSGPYSWKWADGTTIVPDGPLDTNDGGALKLAALKGAGIVHLLRIAVAEELAGGQLVAVLPDLPLPSLPVHALHAFGRQTPRRVRLFIDFLVARFAKMA